MESNYQYRIVEVQSGQNKRFEIEAKVTELDIKKFLWFVTKVELKEYWTEVDIWGTPITKPFHSCFMNRFSLKSFKTIAEAKRCVNCFNTVKPKADPIKPTKKYHY